MFRQVRPSGNYPLDFGVFLHNFVQAGGQDRIWIFRKLFIFNALLICLKGFESPWGYFLFYIDYL